MKYVGGYRYHLMVTEVPANSWVPMLCGIEARCCFFVYVVVCAVRVCNDAGADSHFFLEGAFYYIFHIFFFSNKLP